MNNFDANQPDSRRPRRVRAVPLALAAVGLAGGVLISNLTANAATTSTPTSTSTSTTTPDATTPDATTPDATTPDATTPDADPAASHGTEAPAPASAAAQVKTAVLAKYPGATVTLIETDSDGGYEAEIVTAAGDSIHVSVSATFVVGDVRGGHGRGGHSNTDPAHEAAEGPARAAAEKAADAADAASPTTTG